MSEKAASPVHELPAKAERWAIVIGVARYKDSTLAPLRFPEADAHAVARKLIESGGYEDDHVIVLTTDDPKSAPTIGNLRAELERVKGRHPSSVLIYFSGHGLGFETDGTPRNSLLLQDVELRDQNDPSASSAPWPTDVDLVSELKVAGVDQIVLLIDACRNELKRGARSKPAGSVEPVFQDKQGVSVVYCNVFGEPCFEDERLGSGVFTRYLLDVWSDPAVDGDRDGLISSQETTYHLGIKLKQAPRPESAQQVLAVRGDEGQHGALDLVLAPGAVNTSVRLPRALDLAFEQGMDGDRKAFLATMASIDAVLPNWRRRIRPSDAMRLYRLEAARAAITHDYALASRYLMTLERLAPGDASLKVLWPLGQQVGSLEASHAVGGLVPGMDLPAKQLVNIQRDEQMFVHGERAQTWQPGLPALVQRERKGYGVTYSALLGPSVAVLPEPPRLDEEPAYQDLRRRSWIVFGASAAAATVGWVGETIVFTELSATSDETPNTDPVERWAGFATGATVVSGTAFVWALSLELRY